MSRFSVADVREEAIACGLVEQLSVGTVWRWLDEDALKPWQHRSWIFPRTPGFAAKAGLVLGLYQRRYEQIAVPFACALPEPTLIGCCTAWRARSGR